MAMVRCGAGSEIFACICPPYGPGREAQGGWG